MAASGYGRILPGADAKKIFGNRQRRARVRAVHRALPQTIQPMELAKVLVRRIVRHAALRDAGRYLQNHGIGITASCCSRRSSTTVWPRAKRTAATSTDDWQYIFALPTEAATAWYYQSVAGAPASLADYVNEVRTFAMGEYRNALAQGVNLSPAEYDKIVATLHRYTGALGGVHPQREPAYRRVAVPGRVPA